MRPGEFTWRQSVAAAINRLLSQPPRSTFTLQELKRGQLKQMVVDTASEGRTPGNTLERVLQEMRDDEQIKFVKPGEYRALRSPVE